MSCNWGLNGSERYIRLHNLIIWRKTQLPWSTMPYTLYRRRASRFKCDLRRHREVITRVSSWEEQWARERQGYGERCLYWKKRRYRILSPRRGKRESHCPIYPPQASNKRGSTDKTASAEIASFLLKTHRAPRANCRVRFAPFLLWAP